MMRNNQEYWESRAIDRINRFTADSEKVADELGKAYLMAAQQLKADIAKVFKGFENAFGLSEKEAKALIDGSSGELPSKDIIKAIESIADKDKQREMKAVVSAPAYQFRMKRLDRTAENAKKICESLRTLETRTDTAFLRAEMDKAYKNIIFDIQQGTGISGAFSQIPKSRIEQVLKENWSGKHYSTRIWNNTEKLADEVKQSLVESFMTGAGEREAAAAIQEKFAVGANEARRLIRTENTYVTGQAELEGYKTAQVEEYEYAALIDGRTSEICKALDGKFFKITEAKAGENYPPMHPYCRSSTMAKLPSEEELEHEFDTFAADNIPEGMDFEEWLDGLEPTEDGKLVFRDKRVDKSGKSGIIRLNRTLDRRDKNIGAFSVLEMPMQKKTVISVCKKYGIDTKGLTFKIQRSEKLLSIPFYGSTDYDNVGRIDLFPNAFINEDELVKTILHEKCHVLQLKRYGKMYSLNNIDLMEKKAYRFERLYYNIIAKGRQTL